MTIKNPVSVYDFQIALQEAGQLVDPFSREALYYAITPLIKRIRMQEQENLSEQG